MWARARYDLRLSSAEFYALTPYQYCLLMDRRREDLAHAEMVCGFTTAAVRNSGFSPPETPANALDYMPHHRDSAPKAAAPVLSDEEAERLTDYNIRVAELAAQQKAQAAYAG